MKPQDMKILHIGSALALLFGAARVDALPANAVNTANSCSVCHTKPIAEQPAVTGGREVDGRAVTGIMKVTSRGLLIDLGVQLTGQTRGPLTTFQASPGETVRLDVTVTGVDTIHAVQLKRLEKEGQLNDVTNGLQWSEANATENIWIRQEVTNPPFFTKGLIENTPDGVYSFDLKIDKATPPDVYDLEFAVAGADLDGLYYEDEHFYLQVTSAGTPDVTNISTRGVVGTGGDVMIAGFVIEGTQAKSVLIRASGPGLIQFNVTGTVEDPIITLFNQSDASTAIGSNDNWGSAPNLTELEAAATAVGAFNWEAGSADAAMLITLDPGRYTAKVSGADNGTGVAIVEVFTVD